jgi:hypothetical protein
MRFALAAVEPRSDALAIARLIVPSPATAEHGRCSFNRLVREPPEVIQESESLMGEGRYEFYLRAQEKYVTTNRTCRHRVNFVAARVV